MRLWSLHPCYLDQQGLCGLWREAIMAKNALRQGEDHQYWNHPQLERFKRNPAQDICINYYLQIIYGEALKRGYDFDKDAFALTQNANHKIPTTNGQVELEINHLAEKLYDRNSDKFYDKLIIDTTVPDLHPVFYIVNGDVADWEKSKNELFDVKDS